MKVLSTAAKIVGAIAGIAAIASGLGAPIGAGLLGVSFGTIAAGAAAVSILSDTVTALTAKPPGTLAVGNPEDFKLDPQAPVPYPIGRTATGGYIVHRAAFGPTADDVHNPYQSFGIVWGLGPIEGIEAFQVDRVTTTFANKAAVGNYAGYMWLDTQLGACPEPDALSFAPTPPQWGASYKLSGLAAGLWTLKFDKKGKKFAGGVPQPQAIVKGVKVYDPRLDSTYPGGSGACRALNEATYVYSENPWLHLLTLALGRWQNGVRVFGVGMGIASIFTAQIVEAANIADANGWTAGGVLTSTDAKWDQLKMLGQAGGGEPIRQGAMLSCMVSAPRVSLATITSADLVGKGSVVATQPRRTRINGVVPRVRLEDQGWEVVPLDVVRIDDYVDIDGGERTREIDYQLVQDADQAAELAAYDILNAREFGPITLPLKTRFMGYRPGDCLTLDIPEIGLDAQPAIVTRRSLDPSNGVVTLEFKSETPAKHDFALGRAGTPPPTPSLSVPDLANVAAPLATDWTLTGTSVASDAGALPAIVFDGVVADPNAAAVTFEYRREGDADWMAAGTEPPGTTRKVVTSLAPGVSYEGAVSYQVRGVIGERLILGPVASGDLIDTTARDAADAAASLADGKTTLFYQSTAPRAAESQPNDQWVNTAAGNVALIRVAGSGLLSIGGNALMIGGNRIELPWAEAPDQRIAEALIAAAGAQATADGKVATFNQEQEPTATGLGDLWYQPSTKSLKRWSGAAWLEVSTVGATPEEAAAIAASEAAIAAIGSDNVLSKGEKPQFVREYRRAFANYTAVTTKAAGFGNVADKLAAVESTWSTLSADVSAITPAYDDTSADSPIVGSAINAAWQAFDTAYVALDMAISAQTISVQWSVNGVDDWHDGFVDGDIYQRQSADGGTTWSAAVKIVGEDGEAGANGQFTSFVFTRAAAQPDAPAGDVTPPPGWADAPPAQTDPALPLWQAQADFRDATRLTEWSTPIKLIAASLADLDPAASTLLTQAKSIADGKNTIFRQSAAPRAAVSQPNDIWINTAAGNRTMVRVAGSGMLAIGGKALTIGGNHIELAWAEAPDAQLGEALEEVAGAITKAEAAQATADSATASIETLGDDGQLTGPEKKNLITLDATLDGAWSTLDAQAAGFDITTERTAATNARSAWQTYRNALSPAWNDASRPTPVDRATFRSKIEGYDNALTSLQAAIAAAAAQRADYGLVTGAKPPTNADNTAANQHYLGDTPAVVIDADYQGNVLTGELPALVTVARYLGTNDVTGNTDYSITASSGVTATINNTAGDPQRGTITITGLTVTSATIYVATSYLGVALYRQVQISRQDGATPPPSGGGSGGATSGPVSASSITSPGSSTTHVAMTSALAINVGSSGSINGYAGMTYHKVSGAEDDGVSLSLKWQYSADGSSGWTDIAAEVAGTPAFAWFSTQVPKGPRDNPGSVNCSQTKSGLTPGTTAYLRLMGRKSDGIAAISSVSGSATVKQA